MTQTERKAIIQNALAHWAQAKRSGSPEHLRSALSDMENTFSAVCLWAVPGTEDLRQAILSARKEVL